MGAAAKAPAKPKPKATKKPKAAKAKPKPKPPPPSEDDPLYKFYTSLIRQKPRSPMAIKWLCEHGLGHIVINLKTLNLGELKRSTPPS